MSDVVGAGRKQMAQPVLGFALGFALPSNLHVGWQR